MDITPLIPKDTQIVHAYGNGGFTISHTRYEGSVLLLSHSVVCLDAAHITVLSALDVEALKSHTHHFELLLIGTGEKQTTLPDPLKELLSSRTISYDVMNSGAACRTYNVLVSEGRQVAALLIAV